MNCVESPSLEPVLFSGSEKVWDTTVKLAAFAIALLSDILLLVPALALTIYAACAGSNFDPNEDQVKKEKTPILLIHGNGFNEMQWVLGRQFLNKEDFGSVWMVF